MDDYAKAILASAQATAPTSSPIVTDPTILAHISGTNAAKFAGTQLGPTTSALAGQAGNTADLNANAIKSEILASQQRQAEAKKMVDPSQYRQVQNSAGGYDFLDPNGNKITVQDYAKVVGSNPASVLKDSTDPGDVQFRNDYSNLQDLLQATLDGDKTKLAEYTKNQPELANMKPQDLINKFKAYYTGYFGGQASSNKGPIYSSLDAASGNNELSNTGSTGFN